MTGSFIIATRDDGKLNLQNVTRAMFELNKGSDRAVAIVGGTLIELALTEALTAYLHSNKKISDELFRTTGALGAFATKAHLGLLIGLYGAKAHKDLVTVKDIRNAFAHSLDVSSFKSQKIRDWANNLKLCERYTIDSKERKGPHDPTKGKPIGERAWWFSVADRASALKTPRGRYLMTTQVFSYGLSVPRDSAMPSPLF